MVMEWSLVVTLFSRLNVWSKLADVRSFLVIICWTNIPYSNLKFSILLLFIIQIVFCCFYSSQIRTEIHHNHLSSKNLTLKVVKSYQILFTDKFKIITKNFCIVLRLKSKSLLLIHQYFTKNPVYGHRKASS